MGIQQDALHTYYGTSGEHGSYRQISLEEIIDSFMATYVGENKICENVTLADATFHAIRALQELSYDTLACTKDWEITVPATLVMVMPVDYVNYVKLSWSDNAGIERIIYPTSKSSNPRNITATVSDHGGFAGLSDNTEPADQEASNTMTKFQSQASTDIGSMDANDIDNEFGEVYGGRYGLDPQHSQANGSFFIDEDQGKFYFSSNLAGKSLILRYISDGIAATSASDRTISLANSYVPKLAEEAIYKWILYGVLSARKDTAPGILQNIKKERFAETRKAKLRLSNIKIEELTQILRGKSKFIKH